ncbi:MAG: DUF2721 domain-containing protein [Armatimonadota bacterium]|nr:DUF2721 domain-containing protein [Armatimonadota bacterium]
MDTTPGLLTTITAAVTPVVMISAGASIILGVNQKMTALADRIRLLAAEFRSEETSATRKNALQVQVRLLNQRFYYAGMANLWTYLSVVCFIATVLDITLTPHHKFWDRFGLSLFVTGIILLLIAVVTELLEIRMARRTVNLEVNDVVGWELSQK